MSLRSASTIAEMARQSVEMRIQMRSYVKTDGFRKYIDAFSGALITADPVSPSEEDKKVAEVMSQACATSWQLGSTSVLAPAMTSVVAAAAHSLDLEGETITWDDMPDRGGILFLPEPIYIVSRIDTVMGISAITWHPVFSEDQESGVMVMGYADSTNMNDPEMKMMRETVRKRKDLAHVIGPYMVASAQLVPVNSRVENYKLPGVNNAQQSVWSTNNEDKVVVREEADKVSALVRILYSFWMISQQPIAVSASPSIPKGTDRRALRSGIKHNTRVIMLRRSSDTGYHPTGEARWGYSVRFVVRGHWRRLKDKEGNPYRIWINAYIKGPEDAPLLGGEKVMVLGR